MNITPKTDNRLIIIGIALLAVLLIAASPDYKAFRGTGGIVVTTNPPNGTIVIDGSAIAIGAPDFTKIASTTNVVGVSNWVNAGSNAMVANDITTSNGVLTAARASDNTTSNGVMTLLIANDTTTSNGVLTASRASDTVTSNGLIAVLSITNAVSTTDSGTNIVADGAVAGRFVKALRTGGGITNLILTNISAVPMEIVVWPTNGVRLRLTDLSCTPFPVSWYFGPAPSEIVSNALTRIVAWTNSLGTNIAVSGPELAVVFTNGVWAITNLAANIVQVFNSGYFQNPATNTGNFQVGGTLFLATDVSGSGISSVFSWFGLANTFHLSNTTFMVNGVLGLIASNMNSVWLRPANSNAVPVTNILGIIEKAYAATVELNCNDGLEFVITNRLTGNLTLVVTNPAPGQVITVVIVGEIAGGTSRTVTLIPHTGYVIQDEDAFGTTPTVSSALTATNGNGVEISMKAFKTLGTTNRIAKVSRQFTF